MVFQPEDPSVDCPAGCEYTISPYSAADVITERKDQIFGVNKMVSLKRDHCVSPMLLFVKNPALLIFNSFDQSMRHAN
jgi:hypothetical protein